MNIRFQFSLLYSSKQTICEKRQNIISYGFNWVYISLSTTIILAVSWGIYLLNKKAAKTTYTPLITNIDNILIQLSEDKD